MNIDWATIEAIILFIGIPTLTAVWLRSKLIVNKIIALLDYYNKAKADGVITQDEFNEMVDQLGSIVAESRNLLKDLEDLKAVIENLIKTKGK